jgi:hypothetical protein
MKRMSRSCLVTGWLCVSLLSAMAAGAQQKPAVASANGRAYDMSRETVLQGTVVAYTASSTVAPLGAHVTVQSGASVIDVHLGNAKLLDANHLTLSAGDAVRIVGENLTYGQGTQFVARLLQKGNQVLQVRSTRGFPLVPATAKFGQRTEGGAL